VPCSGRRGNRASEVEVGLLGLPRQNIEPSSLQEKLHVDLTGQGSRGKRHRGKAESPETVPMGAQKRLQSGEDGTDNLGRALISLLAKGGKSRQMYSLGGNA
jgi:hypothetical protein